jgi:hypothetical protein
MLRRWVSASPQPIRPSMVLRLVRRGGGRRDGTAHVYVFQAPSPAPAAASFAPRPPRFRYGERSRPRGHWRPAPGPRLARRLRRRLGAPPLSHPVATARSGGGRTWSRRPGTFGPSSSPEDAAGPRHTHHRCSFLEHVAGAAPRSANWPSPVDAPSRAGTCGLYSYAGSLSMVHHRTGSFNAMTDLDLSQTSRCAARPAAKRNPMAR